MQTFESFHTVYSFFLHAHLDPKYVARIDEEIDNNSASKETKKLIQDVKAFHELRGSLCGQIKDHLSNNAILSELLKSRGLEQYNSVPKQSKCIISGGMISGSQGILLMMDGVRPFVVHNRYKVLLYNFWVLAHLPDEIANEANKWFKKQNWQTEKRLGSIAERVEYISNYQDKVFPKKLYLKLKGIAQYIQRQFPTVPIKNQRNN